MYLFHYIKTSNFNSPYYLRNEDSNKNLNDKIND